MHFVGLGGRGVDPALLSAISVGGSTSPSALHDFGTGPLDVTVSDSTATPFVRVAQLPNGTRSTGVNVADSMLGRESIRVGVVDLEIEITGLDPSSSPNQARATTRIEIGQSTAAPTFLASCDAVLTEIGRLVAPAARGSVTATLGQFDGGAGPFPAPDTLPDIPPQTFDSVSMSPLHGAEGPSEGNWSPSMQAVIELSFLPTWLGHGSELCR